MTAYTYMTASQLVTDKPCTLHSIIVVNDGSSAACVDIYDGAGAESSYIVARIYCGANSSAQYRWEGLPLSRGLYVSFDNHTDRCTVEWEPVGYPKTTVG